MCVYIIRGGPVERSPDFYGGVEAAVSLAYPSAKAACGGRVRSHRFDFFYAFDASTYPKSVLDA